MILWETRFKEVRHDRIANLWGPRLNHLFSVLRGEVQDDDYVQSLLESFAPEWGQLCDEISALLDDLEKEMTPTRAFDRLQSHSRCIQDWMKPIIHNLWITRCQIRQSIQAIVEEMSATKVIVDRIENDLRALGVEDIGNVDDFRGSLKEFKDRFSALWDSLWALEAKIRDIGVPRYR